MDRVRAVARPDWRARVEAAGLGWHTADSGAPYWDETAYWRLTSAEVDRIEAAADELYVMVLAAVDHVIGSGALAAFGYSGKTAELIARSWRGRGAEPSLYARFDLAYDGRELKLLELNGDTPTALVEAAVAQWWWLEDTHPRLDQFNSVHDRLVEAWRVLPRGARVHLAAAADHAEDQGTVEYLAAAARDAGLDPVLLTLDQIGWREGDGPEGGRGRFVDLAERRIERLFKLAPWEWMLSDDFGDRLAGEVLAGRVRLIEPAWKMLASNKRLLVTLRELNPDSDLLLDATTDEAVAQGWGDYVRKPVQGREGADVTLFHSRPVGPPQVVARQGGGSESDAYVYQRRAELAQANGVFAVLGVWVVGGKACGLGVRESDGPITTNLARFVPHLIDG